MNKLIWHILCIAAGENRDKFENLADVAHGWGMERLWYTSANTTSVMRVDSLGAEETLVIINDVVVYLPGKVLGGPEATQLLKQGLRTTGVPEEHIIELKGSETPEEIELVVRQRMHKLLGTVDHQQ